MSEDTAKDLARLQRQLKALDEDNTELELRIQDLEEDLAQAVHLDPYAAPAKVVRVLINQLIGWPPTDWRELAALLEVHVDRTMPTSSTAERRAAPP